ncbi:MAG: AMP-binding protein, partial [Planctomycetia bacterium]|nr:AMP-binding protein [Planctomycetia bacterium]
MFVFQKAQRLDDRGFTSFVLRGEGTRMELGGLPVESIALETRSAQFDLTVQVAEDAGRLAVSAEYNTDLFDAETIDRLLGHYRTLLEAAADDPGQSLGYLPILTVAERSRLALWNATDAPGPAAPCVTGLIERRAAENSDAPAVAAADGSLTYRSLNERANRLAHRLRKLGVGPDVRVAVCAGRTSAAIVGILGVLKAGGAYVPLDPDYPADRLAFMIADSQAPVLLTHDRLLGRIPPCGAKVVSLDDVPDESDRDPEPVAGPDHLAYMIYTSGSTGTPKGVLVTLRNLAHSTEARFLYYREPVGAFLLVSSLAFDSSVAGLFWTLAQGGTLVLPATGEHADPAALAGLVRRHRVTHVLSVPSLYSLLLENAAASDLASLRTAIVAGEPCPRDLPARHHAVLPGASLDNEYGPTEATVWATVHRCAPGDSEGGAGLARGYHGRPDLTAERFLADPFSGEPGARVYRTGDLARYRPDGVIECLGRVDGQVKIRGYRVELGEVESALAAHPSVREAAAAARREPTGETRLVAYLVTRPGASPALTELRAWMAARLPDAMVPSVFSVLDALPLSPNGKVDRAALPDPEPSRLAASAGSEGPRNEVEAELSRLAAELLAVDRVGIHDNFFELGIDSIVAIQLVARARKIGLALAPADLFQNPTVAALASVAGTGQPGPAAPAVDLDPETLDRLARPGLTVEDAYPLTPLQEGMLVHALFSPGRGEYVQQLVCGVRGPLDPSALAESWRRLSDRHAVLRTGFDWPDHGRPLQAVYRGVQTPLEVIDLRGVSPEDQESRIDDALRADRERGFDPSAPPLSRLAVFRLGRDSSRLVWTYHHLLFDGWSLQSVLHELLAIYGGVISSRPVDLPQRAPFRDHVAWLSAQDPARSEPFWRALLKG